MTEGKVQSKIWLSEGEVQTNDMHDWMLVPIDMLEWCESLNNLYAWVKGWPKQMITDWKEGPNKWSAWLMGGSKQIICLI